MAEFKNFDVELEGKLVRLQVEVESPINLVKEALYKFTCHMGKLEEWALQELQQNKEKESGEIQGEDGTDQ